MLKYTTECYNLTLKYIAIIKLLTKLLLPVIADKKIRD